MIEEDIRAYLLIDKPILCLESALSYWGIGTYHRLNPQVFADVSEVTFVGVGSYVPNKFGDSDIDKLNDKSIPATTPFRAICEMIIYDRREELIYEALDDMINTLDVSEKIIMEYAAKYGVIKQMEYYLETLDEEIGY